MSSSKPRRPVRWAPPMAAGELGAPAAAHAPPRCGHAGLDARRARRMRTAARRPDAVHYLPALERTFLARCSPARLRHLHAMQYAQLEGNAREGAAARERAPAPTRWWLLREVSVGGLRGSITLLVDSTQRGPWAERKHTTAHTKCPGRRVRGCENGPRVRRYALRLSLIHISEPTRPY